MLTGFNTNIRHRAVLFHVQSEDSGRAHPHVITHLYYGGSILQSRKSGYADQLEAKDLPAVVKVLMEEQHKAVLKSLVQGEFDDVIRERLGPEVFSDAGDSRAETQPVAPQVEESEADAAPVAAGGGTFGDGIVSEEPLDEVILGYLIENARKRKRTPS